MPNNEGIVTSNKKYENYIHKTLPAKISTAFLAHIRTLNNFVFNSEFYL